jgi:arylsulfatase A-like enzyme
MISSKLSRFNQHGNRANRCVMTFYWVCTCYWGTIPSYSLDAVEKQRPNVIVILADDLGWSDTTLYGNTKFYQTPQLARLAKRGMTFTRAYSASPLCSPTRSALLTGQSPARTGITTPNCHLPEVVLEASVPASGPADSHAIMPKPPTRLKTEYRTLAETLKEVGYATGHFGKWHLGPDPYSPLQQGFDVDMPHTAGPGPAGSFVAPWKFKDFDHDPQIPDEHIEDRMAKEATAFIEKHQHKPFYLNYWMFSVHAPFDAKKALIEKHRSRVDPNDSQRSPTYAAMIESMDDAVGTLLDTLDRLKIADNTIIVFTSDNGGNMYNEVDGTTPTSNRPLRGGKATVFEGGTRVPAIIVWPGVVTAATRSDSLIQSEDYYPTLLAGLNIRAQPTQIFDGVSLLPLLKGQAFDRGAIFQYFPHSAGVPDWLPPSVTVHRGDWKLIRIFHGGPNKNHRHLLYNLRDDIGETTNVAHENLELVQELDGLIQTFLERTKAVVPLPNPKFDPTKYHPKDEGKQKAKGEKRDADASKSKTGSQGVWQFSNDTQLAIEKDRIKITATGGDPWISTRKLPGNGLGPFVLKLRMTSSGNGNGTLFFSDSAKNGFNKKQSVDFAVKHDGISHDYEITLPPETISAIRLDPGNSVGDVVIERFELLDKTGRLSSLLAN